MKPSRALFSLLVKLLFGRKPRQTEAIVDPVLTARAPTHPVSPASIANRRREDELERRQQAAREIAKDIARDDRS